jgi:hypothetical protein
MSYYFTEFLNTYGLPDNVWIRTYRNEYFGDLPFGIALFYMEEGVLAEYYVHGLVQGDKVIGCPQEGDAPFLGLWPPSHKISFWEANRMFGVYYESWGFRSLEDATQMDVEAFYRTFRDPNNLICLETPTELWLSQP